MIELLAQFPHIDEIGDADGAAAVLDAEGHVGVAMAAKDRLRHQELVEIGIEQRPDDRVDLEIVVVNPRREIEHGREGSGAGPGRPLAGEERTGLGRESIVHPVIGGDLMATERFGPSRLFADG